MADFGLFYGWRSEGDKRYVSPPHISTQGLGGTDFDRRNMKSRDEQHENFVVMMLIMHCCGWDNKLVMMSMEEKDGNLWQVNVLIMLTTRRMKRCGR